MKTIREIWFWIKFWLGMIIAASMFRDLSALKDTYKNREMLAKIIKLSEKHGPFKSVEELEDFIDENFDDL